MTNQLYYGDNLEVLQKYIKDESVDLVYIDPPFNSKRNYNQIYNNEGKEDKAQVQAFVDTWEWNHRAEKDLETINDSTEFTTQTKSLIRGLLGVLGKGAMLAYITSMTRRITEIYRVLKPTGSFYLHCDDTASHYLKLLCDSIFVARGGDFLNEIVWKRTEGHNNANRFGRIQDKILFYSKSDTKVFNKIYGKYSEEQISRYKYQDESGYYKAENLTAPFNKLGSDSNRQFIWRGVHPGQNRVWRFSEEKLEDLYNEGSILLTRDGKPRKDGLKEYLKTSESSTIQDLWTDIARIGNTSKERLGYPTQKPLALLERIIEASSNEGDVVMDCYCGCGTAVVAAQKLNRQWIGADITYQSVSLILKRIEDTYGKDFIKLPHLMMNGVPRDMSAAIALAHKEDDRVRKEFEKWAVLTYSNNRGMINDKKGGDGGIDGMTEFPKDWKKNYGKVLFSVKSDKTINPSYVDQLAGVVNRDNADMGVLICLHEPSKGTKQRASEYGTWKHPLVNQEFEKVRVITIEEMLRGQILEGVLGSEVLKSAQRDWDYGIEQGMLGIEEE